MKTKEELIFSVVALEGLLKVEGLYEDVLRIMDEYADKVKNCTIPLVSNAKRTICHCTEPRFKKNVQGHLLCQNCGKP